jgi:hypothetical protein
LVGDAESSTLLATTTAVSVCMSISSSTSLAGRSGSASGWRALSRCTIGDIKALADTGMVRLWFRDVASA